MESNNSFKIGDTVTATTIGEDGKSIFVSGEIASLTDKYAFLLKKFPKVQHFSVKIEDIVIRNK
jgi:hypothetical protein|tara:strand:- start:1449 stop:1640 length:192 start_codon:yes stop_codon:yes gene_type:complete